MQLPCTAAGNPPVQRTWFRGEMMLSSGGRISLFRDRLRISDAEEADSGIYNCTISNNIDGMSMSDSINIQLIIQSKCICQLL